MNIKLETRHLQTILKSLAQTKRRAVTQAERQAATDCICSIFSQVTQTATDRVGLSREQIDCIEKRAQSAVNRVRQEAAERDGCSWEIDHDCETFLGHRR